MKAAVFAALIALIAVPAMVHAGEMQGMDMKGMGMKGDKGMDTAKGTHKAVGVVKKVDPKAATVTLDHEPVKSMSWPAMTMTFQVKDKAMLDKFSEGKKVEFEFEQRGKDYVITGAR